MLQVSVLRNDPAHAKARLLLKGFQETEWVDTILELDDRRKKAQLDFDQNQARLNQSSKQIGMLMGSGKKEEAEQLKAEVADLKATLEPLKEQLQQLEKQLHDALVILPNLPAQQVPAGKSAEDNQVVRTGGKEPALSADAKPHWDLIQNYRLV
ncbi:MAG: serine--tRNA ligase, partial [Chitinophagaceae bacterium]|nr:serine--tRNA ligase [Chitinophagaceae bacterium]